MARYWRSQRPTQVTGLNGAHCSGRTFTRDAFKWAFKHLRPNGPSPITSSRVFSQPSIPTLASCPLNISIQGGTTLSTDWGTLMGFDCHDGDPRSPRCKTSFGGSPNSRLACPLIFRAPCERVLRNLFILRLGASSPGLKASPPTAAPPIATKRFGSRRFSPLFIAALLLRRHEVSCAASRYVAALAGSRGTSKATPDGPAWSTRGKPH